MFMHEAAAAASCAPTKREMKSIFPTQTMRTDFVIFLQY